MRSSSEDAGSAVSPSAGTAELEELYCAIGSVLLRTLDDMYGMPRDDAEKLVGEVFSMYVSTNEPGGDPASWIHLAVHAEAAAYLRKQAALDALPEDAREAWRLHVQNRTFAEIASALGVTKRFAEKLVAKALAELRARGLQ